MTNKSEQPSKRSKSKERSSSAFRESRRKFTQRLAVVLGVTAVGGGGWWLWQNTGERRGKEPTLQESLKFIETEISENQDLESLLEYGEKKTLLFIGHAYNIFSRITQSATTAETVSSTTRLGDSTLFAFFERKLNPKIKPGDPDYKTDFRDDVGKTFDNAATGGQLIAFNTDAYLLNKNSLNPLDYDVPIQDTVLGNLFDAALHEPFHYEVGAHDIDPPITDVSGDTTYSFNEFHGLNISAATEAYPYDLNLSNQFDEITIYLIHRDLLTPEIRKSIPSYTYAPPREEKVVVAVESILRTIGYPTATSILELRRESRAGLILLEKIGERLPDNTYERTTTVTKGIAFLGKLQNAFRPYNDGVVAELLDLLE